MIFFLVEQNIHSIVPIYNDYIYNEKLIVFFNKLQQEQKSKKLWDKTENICKAGRHFEIDKFMVIEGTHFEIVTSKSN